jgi:hypothetical protein
MTERKNRALGSGARLRVVYLASLLRADLRTPGIIGPADRAVLTHLHTDFSGVALLVLIERAVGGATRRHGRRRRRSFLEWICHLSTPVFQRDSVQVSDHQKCKLGTTVKLRRPPGGGRGESPVTRLTSQCLLHGQSHRMPTSCWRKRTYATISCNCSRLTAGTGAISPKFQWWARTPRSAAMTKATSA